MHLLIILGIALFALWWFGMATNRKFFQAKDSVDQKLAATANSAKQMLSGVTPGGVYDEIAKLAKLKDKGVLTEEEFTSQKQYLLKRIAEE
jgi:hypothetical protein